MKKTINPENCVCSEQHQKCISFSFVLSKFRNILPALLLLAGISLSAPSAQAGSCPTVCDMVTDGFSVSAMLGCGYLPCDIYNCDNSLADEIISEDRAYLTNLQSCMSACDLVNALHLADGSMEDVPGYLFMYTSVSACDIYNCAKNEGLEQDAFTGIMENSASYLGELQYCLDACELFNAAYNYYGDANNAAVNLLFNTSLTPCDIYHCANDIGEGVAAVAGIVSYDSGNLSDLESCLDACELFTAAYNYYGDANNAAGSLLLYTSLTPCEIYSCANDIGEGQAAFDGIVGYDSGNLSDLASCLGTCELFTAAYNYYGDANNAAVNLLFNTSLTPCDIYYCANDIGEGQAAVAGIVSYDSGNLSDLESCLDACELFTAAYNYYGGVYSAITSGLLPYTSLSVCDIYNCAANIGEEFNAISALFFAGVPAEDIIACGAPCEQVYNCTDDGDICTDEGCDPSSGCTYTPADCDDANACTDDECFSAGPATRGIEGCLHTPVICDDGDHCTDDACDPIAGCIFTPIDCDDGDACTIDGCIPSGGDERIIDACFHLPIICDDYELCTIDGCDPTLGCVYSLINCDDDEICTFDICVFSFGCTHEPVNCDDDDPCTNDACNPATGCSNTPIVCDDNNACTIDQCINGACIAQILVDCDDSDSCTIDNCDPVMGCFHTPNPNCQPCSLEVVSFTLVNSSSNADIRPLNANDTIKLSCTPDINIRANLCVEPVGSVRFKVNFNNNFRTENVAPYALAGDGPPANYFDWNVSPGLYTITATPYSGSGATGTSGTPKTITVLVQGTNVPCAPQCTTPADCDDADACTTDGCEGGVCANTPVSCDDNNACTQDICLGGFCIYVDLFCIDGDACTINDCDPVSGCITTPNPNCCQINTDCDDNDACTIDDCDAGVCENSPAGIRVITSFTLVNSSTNLDFGPVDNGSVIDLADNPNINIRANLCTNTGTESVRFKLNSNNNFRMENDAPYALVGDAPPGDYHKWNVTPNTYTITATPYSGNNATGTVGTAKTITIEVINSNAKLHGEETASFNDGAEQIMLSAYPNPFSNRLTVFFGAKEAGKARVEIAGMDGRQIATLFDGHLKENEMREVEFRSGELANGMYFYRMITESGVIENRKLLLVR